MQPPEPQTVLLVEDVEDNRGLIRGISGELLRSRNPLNC